MITKKYTYNYSDQVSVKLYVHFIVLDLFKILNKNQNDNCHK